ncbi:MAG: protein tyrosine phosphatase [Elusimicrobia bacterium RIFCSPHIGHO2_02_FULL_57_9]|nr:MAG: protein tyrosine phosphatase [Elusimicrobia bacterium RIFCSPHIGHO2_02_FULL_57_9]
MEGELEACAKKKVLFVCVENSCRSQMAEGYARALGKKVLQAWSAGSKPSGNVDENAIKTMQEDGIDISGHLSKGLTDLPFMTWDCIVTMGCGDGCPSLPAKKRLDWDFPDPRSLSPEDFRRVRDDIKSRVRDLIEEAS